MLFDVAMIAAGMGKAFLDSLRQEGVAVKALATDEANKLAASLATIGQLLRDGEIDQEEAEALIAVQKNATETVFASLQGIGRVAARRATRAGLSTAVSVVDAAIGVPLLGTLLAVASAHGRAAPV